MNTIAKPAHPDDSRLTPRDDSLKAVQLRSVRAVPQISELDRDEHGPIPFVMIRGAWLRKLGFQDGMEVRIEGRPYEITVKPNWEVASAEPSRVLAVRYADVAD